MDNDFKESPPQHVVLILLPTDIPLAPMLLSILGKTFITMAYTTVYLHGSEVFPTEIRSVGLGAASTVESIGAMLAPAIGGLLV